MATSNLQFRIIGDDDASPAFLKVAASAKLLNATFSDLGKNALGLTKLIGGAGLIPVAAVASAALIELSTSAAAGAGALGIFGASVGTTLAAMVKQQQAIATTKASLDILKKGSTEYATALEKLHRQQQAFNQDFGAAAVGFNKMSAAFADFKAKTRSVSNDVLGKAFSLLASVLPKLVPISNAAGRAVGGLIDELSGWTKSPAFDGLLNWFETSGPKAITHFGHIVGNILDGLGGILSNFVGPGDKAAAALDKLTKRFAEWGHSKGVSDSVDKFLRYVHDNGPAVASVFVSLAAILPKLASSFGGLGSVDLVVVSSFLKLLAGMPQGVFDVVVNGLFGIVVATKALNIVLGINALITGMTVAITALGDACIATRIGLAALWVTEKVGAAVTKGLAAAQWLLNAAMDANPIGIVVVALAALAVGLVIAYKKSETFRNIVNGAFKGVMKVVGAVVGFIQDHWKAMLIALTGGIGLAVVIIVKNWDKITAAIKAVAAVGKWLWNSIFQPVFKFIAGGIATLISLWANMLHALSHIPGFGWAGDLANKLDAAASKARALADGINKIPSHKTATIVINTIHHVVHTTGGHVPAMAAGGIVTRPTVALIGEAGPEAVVPLSGRGARRLGGTTVNITVNASGLVDAPSMAKAIEAELTKLKSRRGGRQLGFV